MLCAWVVSRSDEGLGYASGASRIAAMIVVNMQPQQGFIVMRNLLERHCMRSFFGGMAARDDVSFAPFSAAAIRLIDCNVGRGLF
jgi:TBC1 domain family member 14